MFGEAFSCAGTDKLPVNVVAAKDVEVLLIDYLKIITSCSSACVFHTQLIKNMLSVIRYELSDSEWERIQKYIPTAKTGRPPKDHRQMLNAMLDAASVYQETRPFNDEY